MVSIYVWLVLVLGCVLTYGDAAIAHKEKKVVCYYTNWSYKRVEPYSFTPEKIDPFICTHIIYAFADIGFRNNLIFSDPDFDFSKRGYSSMMILKKKNKNLKVMVGIGGWSKGTLGFGRITSNDTNRKEFAKNAARFIRGYNFDGLDLNWQHPTFREGGTPEDKGNYVLLAQCLREEFEKDAFQKNKTRLLLSIAISHHEKFLPAYDLPGFNNYMDFISVICYDYHFSYEDAVNHHSPLYSLVDDEDADAKVNINNTIHYFLEFADPDKLVLGIPTYGRTYKLENPTETTLGSFADGAGDKGPITKEKGWFSYFEICNFVKNENWTVVQTKPGYAGPYAYKGNQWVCYDDVDMIKQKTIYAKQKGLGGVMFWTIDYDDYLGKCQETTFPIIRAARNELSSFDPMFLGGNDENVPLEETSKVPIETEPKVDNKRTELEDVENDSNKATSIAPEPDNKLARSPLWSEVPPPPPSTVPSTPPAPPTPPPPFPTALNVPLKVNGLDPTADEDRSDEEIVRDLLRLIERAGGLGNFCKILRKAKAAYSTRFVQKRGSDKTTDSENNLVFNIPRQSPLLLSITNSSITIQELNVYNRERR